MNDFVRILNPAEQSGSEITVQTIRQDIAPGEPNALMGHVTLRPQEAALFELYEGSVIVIGKEA